MQAILFINYTDEDFAHKWGGVTYTFKAGTSMYLEPYLAEHFAKHFVDRELNKMNVGKKPTEEIRLDSQQHRNVILEKCIKVIDTEAKGDAQLHSELLNLNMKKEETAQVSVKELEKKPFCDQCTSKGVRHKKDCPKNNAAAPKE